MLKMRLIEDVHGFVLAMHGMREPYKLTEKSDSRFNNRFEEVGPKDAELAKKLALAGPTHAKYRRMIMVWVEVTAPLYWWKEFDTYKVGTVANSESTMHTIEKKPFELEDFSCEHLMEDNRLTVHYAKNDFRVINNKQWMLYTCDLLNAMREAYLETKDKIFWWQIIQLLPSSYNQTRMVCLNYEVLSHIYADRRNHKLDEWREFCKWIKSLPHAKEMIFPEEEETMDDRKRLQLAVGKAVNMKVARILYEKMNMTSSEIGKVLDIPESVVRTLLKEEEE